MDRLAAGRAAAARLLSPEVFDYLDAGAGDEVARAEACDAWRRYRLRPRVLTDVTEVDTSVELLGTRLTTPVLVAPMAFHALAHPEGERATARGVAAAGSLLTVSTRSSTELEHVHETPAPWWFQVYVTREPAAYRGAVARARAAGATALVLTGDTPVLGSKPRLERVRIAQADAWLAVNLGRHLPAGADPRSALEQSPAVTVDAIAELRALSGLPVLVKGVLRGDEARRCVDAGADGIVVSNHGGRQLDRAVSSALALPEVVAAVGADAPVVVDGGIGGGLDVATALSLGARAVMVGRPVLWALATGGSDGVENLLRSLHDELTEAMRLLGARSLAALTPDLVVLDR